MHELDHRVKLNASGAALSTAPPTQPIDCTTDLPISTYTVHNWLKADQQRPAQSPSGSLNDTERGATRHPTHHDRTGLRKLTSPSYL